MVPRLRRTGAILYLALLAIIAFSLGNTLGQALTVIAVLGWITVAGMAVYMVLFRNMKFTLFKDEPVLTPAEVASFDENDRVLGVIEDDAGGRTVLVEKN